MDKSAIDVAYVAELARLELTDEEKAVFQPQLENIVKYVVWTIKTAAIINI